MLMQMKLFTVLKYSITFGIDLIIIYWLIQTNPDITAHQSSCNAYRRPHHNKCVSKNSTPKKIALEWSSCNWDWVGCNVQPPHCPRLVWKVRIILPDVSHWHWICLKCGMCALILCLTFSVDKKLNQRNKIRHK